MADTGTDITPTGADAAAAVAREAAAAEGVAAPVVGRSTGIGTEYGDPYDPNVPPWPIYNDPARAAIEEHEAREAEWDKMAEKAKGTEYTFVGHQSPREGTETLITSSGRVQKGGVVKLSKDEHQVLTNMGFVLEKA